MKVTAEQAYDLWYNGHTNRYGLSDATVVYRSEMEYDSYGDAYEGTVIMVIDLYDQTYKLTGRNDSYGSIDWDDEAVRAEPTTKTIQVWE